MRKQVIIFPFGGGAREAAEMITQADFAKQLDWEIIGFIDDDKTTWGKNYLGYPVLGSRESLNTYPDAFVLVIPGSPQTFRERKKIIESFDVPSHRFASFVHSDANLAGDTKLGYNILIYPGVVTTASVVIGNHCAIASNTVIAHDCIIGDYTLIAPGVLLAGYVNIGENCYIGMGARIKERVIIGKQSLIGMGAVVISDVMPYSTVAGNPAREIA